MGVFQTSMPVHTCNGFWPVESLVDLQMFATVFQYKTNWFQPANKEPWFNINTVFPILILRKAQATDNYSQFLYFPTFIDSGRVVFIEFNLSIVTGSLRDYQYVTANYVEDVNDDGQWLKRIMQYIYWYWYWCWCWCWCWSWCYCWYWHWHWC